MLILFPGRAMTRDSTRRKSHIYAPSESIEWNCAVFSGMSKEVGDVDRQVEAIMQAMLWYRISISHAKPMGSCARRFSREVSRVLSH